MKEIIDNRVFCNLVNKNKVKIVANENAEFSFSIQIDNIGTIVITPQAYYDSVFMQFELTREKE